MTSTQLSAAAPERSSRPPNIIVIFADDLAYADIEPFGAKSTRTPNLNRLARQGVRFTDFYVAQPVCSASRAALLTGCYPNRIGIRGALGPSSQIGINSAEMTLAEVVKQKNYATGIVGKWHLGHHPPFLPTRHGFDQYFGLPYSNDMWPHHPEAKPGSYPPLPLIEQDHVLDPEISPEEQIQLTTQYTERAVGFIDQNAAKPFFLYVAHAMPHVPLFVSNKFRGKSRSGLHGDVIMEIDWSVGQILDALTRHKLDENTLVIFTSDNGPWLSYGDHAGSAGPLREGKGTCWEGGVRVPFIARWKGTIPARSVCREPAMTIDLLPTIARLIGAQLPQHPIDGRDIWPLLISQPGAKSPHPALFFYYNSNDLQAIRSGPWKLILPHTYRTLVGVPKATGGVPAKYQSAQAALELYNVKKDPGEKHDLAQRHPNIVQRLLQFAESARADLGDDLTKRSPSRARPPGKLDL